MRWFVVLTQILAAVLVCGCAENSATSTASSAPGSGRSDLQAGSGKPRVDDVPVRGAVSGVEVRSLAVMDDGSLIASALSPYAANAAPMDAATREAWSGCGLRLVFFPATEIVKIQAALDARAASGLGRLWIAPGPTWVEAVRGGNAPETVALHDSRLELPPSVLRLLARCWTEPVESSPGADPAAVLCVEIVPQAFEPPRKRGIDEMIASGPVRTRAEEQGLVLTRLMARIKFTPGSACAIVYEAPGANWSSSDDAKGGGSGAQGERPDGTPRLGEVTRAPDPARPERASGEDHEKSEQGPRADEPPGARAESFGEVLLVGAPVVLEAEPNPLVQSVKTRSVLFLVPRVPERFTLLGGAPTR